MKNFCSIVFFVSLSAISQTQITYQLSLGDREIQSNAPSHVVETAKKSYQAAKDLVLFLDVDGERSHFYSAEGMESDGSRDNFHRGLALIEYVGGDEFWMDASRNITIQKSAGKNVLSQRVVPDWKISSVTKKIDKYNCYKAEYIHHFTSWKGQEVSRTITAWFAPELPLPFGPSSYFGLPGLILELNDGRLTTYIATSIKRDAKIPEIKFPQNTIDQAENDKQAKETMERINSRK